MNLTTAFLFAAGTALAATAASPGASAATETPAPAAATTAPAPAKASAAKGTRVALLNAGFESIRPGRDGSPEGWSASQHAGQQSYDFVLDSGVKKSGTQSLRVRNIGPEPWGIVQQPVPASALGSRTVRLSAWMRTVDIPEDGRRNGATLLVIAKRGGQVVASESMRKREIKGTSDWTRRSIELAVPAGATDLEIGVSLQGAGTVWIDDFELEVLDR